MYLNVEDKDRPNGDDFGGNVINNDYIGEIYSDIFTCIILISLLSSGLLLLSISLFKFNYH